MRLVLLGLALVAVVTACASGRQAAGSSGHLIGRPVASVSAQVMLRSRTITAGTAVMGRVIVDNRTGHTLRVPGCLGLFQVALTSRTYHPAVAWASCLQTLAVPAGRSSYRVTVAATYSQCGQGPPHGTIKACLPGNRMPPLPPGRYNATLFQSSHVVTPPPPLAVRVTPRGKLAGEPTACDGGDLTRFRASDVCPLRQGGAMRDLSSSPPQPDPAPLRRIRHSPAASAAAMVLFVVVSALWLVAAGTARPAVISQPGCQPGRACPQPPSYVSLHVWLLLGIAGAVLTLASFVLVARRAIGERREAGSAREVRLAVVTVVAGAVAEVLLVSLVTHVAIVTAPLGFEYSGETATPILILGVAQLALVGALALVWGRLLRLSLGQSRPSARRIRSWTAVLGLGGMVLGCGAFAAWSLRAGTIPLVVNTRLIGGPAWVTNVGAWWPGLFAAMVALFLAAAACTPGMISPAEGTAPRMPSPNDRTVSPANAP